MVNWMSNHQVEITDFNVGSVTRTMLEAVAIEMEEVYYRIFESLGTTITEAIYNAFDFPSLPATTAVGKVVFSRNTPAPSDISIPFGTIVETSDGIQFEVADYDAKILTGTMVDNKGGVAIAALVVGSASNINEIGVVNRIVGSIPGIDSVSNPAMIIGGSDFETDAQRRSRFNLYIQSLARGTLLALEFAALNSGADTTTAVRIVTAKAIDNQPVFVLSYPRGGVFNLGVGGFTDYSVEANMPYEQAFPLIDISVPWSTTTSAFTVFASNTQFDSLYIDMTQVGQQTGPVTGITGNWYYWNSALNDWALFPLANYSIDEFAVVGAINYIYLAKVDGDLRRKFLIGSTITTTGDQAGTYTILASLYDTVSERTQLRVLEAVINQIAPWAIPPTLTIGDETHGLLNSGAVRFDLNSIIASEWTNVLFLDGDTPGAAGRTLFPIKFQEQTATAGNEFSISPVAIQTFIAPEPGVVHLFVSDGSGGLSDNGKQAVEDSVEHYRAAGVDVKVIGPIQKHVRIKVGIRVSGAYDSASIIDMVTTGLATLTSGYSMGRSLFSSVIIQYVMNLNSSAILSCEILELGQYVAPNIGDIVASPNQLLIADVSDVEVVLM